MADEKPRKPNLLQWVMICLLVIAVTVILLLILVRVHGVVPR